MVRDMASQRCLVYRGQEAEQGSNVGEEEQGRGSQVTFYSALTHPEARSSSAQSYPKANLVDTHPNQCKSSVAHLCLQFCIQASLQSIQGLFSSASLLAILPCEYFCILLHWVNHSLCLHLPIFEAYCQIHKYSYLPLTCPLSRGTRALSYFFMPKFLLLRPWRAMW